MGYIEMIKDSDITHEEKEIIIDTVSKRLKRIKELIDAFFEFSKVISGHEQPALSEVNLVALLEE